MHGLAIGGVAVERRGRHIRTPGPLVAQNHPEPAGLGLAQAWCENRHRGVVGMQDATGPNMTADRLGQRGKQEHGMADPIRQGRAVKLDAFAGVDLALPVER
jgi:hypothetical protein